MNKPVTLKFVEQPFTLPPQPDSPTQKLGALPEGALSGEAGLKDETGESSGNGSTFGSELIWEHARNGEETALDPSRYEEAITEYEPHIERTPVEFARLYSTIERRLGALSGSERIGANLLGNEDKYALGVTSSIQGEGKTTVALHLAMSAARNTFKKVCLLDLSLTDDDLFRRMGHKNLGKGVINLLEEFDPSFTALQLTDCDNLFFMPAGKVPDNPARTARSPRVGELITAVRRMFDIVIVDLPAVSTENALPLAAQMDGVVLVVSSGVTPRDTILRARNDLGSDRVVGVVLNRVSSSCPRWLRNRFKF